MRRSFAVEALVGMVVVSCASSAPAPAPTPATVTLRVDVSSAAGGDGGVDRPYSRITDALARARALRSESSAAPIVVRVSAGRYIGSYDPVKLAADPTLEVLPLLLDVPDVELRGETVLIADEHGVPRDIPASGATVLTSDGTVRGPTQSLIAVTRTSDARAGNNVSIVGMVLDAVGAASGGANAGARGIYVDQVAGFAVRASAVRGFNTGIQTRLASGTIESDLLSANAAAGAIVSAGSAVRPARVSVRRNRGTGNAVGVLLFGTVNPQPLDLGMNRAAAAVIANVFDAADDGARANIPNQLDVTVADNDLSGNTSAGLRIAPYAAAFYDLKDPAGPLTASMSVTVTGNSLHHNGDYGIIVDAGFPYRTNTRPLTATVVGSFERNDASSNGRSDVLFDFTRSLVSLGSEPPAAYKYLDDSTYRMTISPGTVTYDLADPATDPASAALLMNVLTINGTDIPAALKISRP